MGIILGALIFIGILVAIVVYAVHEDNEDTKK